MATDMYDKGLAKRKTVLGDSYVDNAIHNAGPFAADFQAYLTEYAWGAVWTDDTLSDKQRSMMNVCLLAALNRMHEWELHFRGAITNGVSRDELAAIIKHIACYAGIPVGVECHRIAKKVFAELDGDETATRKSLG
jgi:4-carboxymuconolactone decarboxylase